MKRYTGAVDIGGTKIAVGIVDDQGTVLTQRTLSTKVLGGSEAGVAAIAETLQQCREECGQELVAIGIGCTGPIDPLRGTVGTVALLPGWEGCALVDKLREGLALPVAMENDADAAALAEYRWGGHGRPGRFIYATISTGIGVGILLDGSIYRGTRGIHPEVGHHCIDPHGPPCYCGASGCWESLCSGTAISINYARRSGDNKGQTIDCDARQVFERAADQDPEAKSTVAQFISHMSMAVANLITLYAPDRIVLGGGVSLSLSPLLPQIRLDATLRAREVPAEVQVTTASLGTNAGLVGAAAVGFKAEF